MTVAFYTNIISPHQIPWCRAFAARIGAENFRYIYVERLHDERVQMGWSDATLGVRCLLSDEPEAQEWLENADVLMSGRRDLDLMERRVAAGKPTIYSSERWFKPPLGFLRLIDPRYLRMAFRFVRLARRSPYFWVFPIGVHAQRDFARLGVPREKMYVWGYFVEPSDRARGGGHSAADVVECSPIRVLWVGRLLRWKKVDTLIRAFRLLDASRYELTLVGTGPDEARLLKLSAGRRNIHFSPPVPIEQVRELMQSHDVYILPSNGYEGWGAVVSEALEEGMIVLGSRQAGASATVLPQTHLFDCGDLRRVATLLGQVLAGRLHRVSIGAWSASAAAERLDAFCSTLPVSANGLTR